MVAGEIFQWFATRRTAPESESHILIAPSFNEYFARTSELFGIFNAIPRIELLSQQIFKRSTPIAIYRFRDSDALVLHSYTIYKLMYDYVYTLRR